MIFYSTSIYSFIISFVQSLYSWECVFILLDLTKIRIVALELVPVLSNVPNTTLLMKIVDPLPLNLYNEAPQFVCWPFYTSESYIVILLPIGCFRSSLNQNNCVN